MLKEMFKKTGHIHLPGKLAEPSVPEGLWIKCPKCGETLYKDDVVGNHYVCYRCGGYFRVRARNRIRMVADPKSFEEWDRGLETPNPLHYEGYQEKIAGLKEKTKLDEAVVTGKIRINGEEAVIGICDVRFLMGSMGYVVGEKLTRAIEKATELRLPLILFTASGGARMQEGIVSLMQMAKTSAALRRHSDAGLLYITILTDPTTGGVTASFAMLGDIILAEPGALVGFAGPRVIEQTIGQKLPKGFQSSEFLLEHGIIDGIVERMELKDTLYHLICLHKEAVPGHPEQSLDASEELYDKKSGDKKKRPANAWEKVQAARSAERPTSLDYIEHLFDGFMELHGDRAFRDDGPIVGGIASFHGLPVTVIGQQKGKNTKENISRNFGMPYPEGYRKAQRLMKQAEKFGRPVLCFVDTSGAFCGTGAEERGQGLAIAENLCEMMTLKVPILTVFIGEGGSGGALALAVADQVWMLENAYYAVISPEGCASILWKDSKKVREASDSLRCVPEDLLELGLIERILPESDQDALWRTLPLELSEEFDALEAMTSEERCAKRYARFRKMGVFKE